ncbi:MAG TPA: DUF484 family protein [Xylella sp.]
MSEAKDKIGAYEVAAWLRRHPAFLKQFPDLALALVVPRENASTISLASYQLEVLRDKNRQLSSRLAELKSNAQVNEQLAMRTHQLTLVLMRQTSVEDTLRVLVASLTDDFDGDCVRLVLLRPVAALQAAWLQVIEPDDVRCAPLLDCLRDGEPMCGRLNADQQVLLYAEVAGEVQSSVLLPVSGLGLIAIGSYDPNRFYPGMGTLFLRMMGEALLDALKRFHV